MIAFRAILSRFIPMVPFSKNRDIVVPQLPGHPGQCLKIVIVPEKSGQLAGLLRSPIANYK